MRRQDNLANGGDYLKASCCEENKQQFDRLHVSRSKYPSLETLTTTEETPANEHGITDNREKDQVVPKIRGHDTRKEM
ncbi:MAG: hypothetical protein M3298_02120 [Thermoproteota archaeon]|nr:hypothetical protein [Thermoproteota archaeon]MDQ3806942.1 hypothetical protein [Thermoproteota archaeon]MDQ5843105.1 hypothetical protein [Thermoproteota archaeon]